MNKGGHSIVSFACSDLLVKALVMKVGNVKCSINSVEGTIHSKLDLNNYYRISVHI